MSSPIHLRRVSVAIIVLVFMLGTAVARAQQTIHVPADQPTIQAAINAANNGDTVLVAPGTYAENINFGGKSVSVTSSGGPSVTTIDGGTHGSVVTFSNSEGLTSVLNGFTVRNGLQDGLSGAGIYIAGASPTIAGNIITGNHAAEGCGIYVHGGSPLIQNNTITANDQKGAGDGAGGGGIYVSGSSSAPSNPQIIGNTITNNSVAGGGYGGGILADYFSGPLIQGNLIQGNVAYNFGGGVALQSFNSLILVQNLIVSNTSQGGGSGGGLYLWPTGNPVQIINNTIAANSAYDHTSAVYVTGSGQNATFTNNIFVAAAGQNAVTCDSTFSSVSPVFSYNDAFSASGSAWAGICDSTTNPGNLSSDPLFMSSPNNDFHLQEASPAVNAGNNAATNLPATDFDGNPRIVGTIDLGVYEVVNTSAANISPNSLSFVEQAIGTSSAPQSATLTSTGSTGFQITSFQITSGFSATTTCLTLSQPGGFSGVASGNACMYSVSFTPSADTPIGAVTGTLTVNGTNGASLAVSLSGTALSPNLSVSLSTNSLQFPLQQAGTTSAPQPVTLTNSGASALSIAGITASQQFSETDNCGSSLAGGASCLINVSFAPTSSGNINGTLTVTDNASGSPQTVALNGQGGTPIATVSPSILGFANQGLLSTSAPQDITLSNTGNFTLTLNSITASGDFAQTNNCGGTLAPNASCVISVTFTPTATGARSGVLTIVDNSFYGSTQSISLSGTGVTPAAVSLSPSSLTFPATAVGSTSTQTITLTNTGEGTMSITVLSYPNPFSVPSQNCLGALAGGASCQITVAFKPTANGSFSGVLQITDTASGSPHSVPLTGATPAAASLSPSSLAFPGQVIGTTSAAQTVTLTNSGGASLNISGIATSQPYAQTNGCPASLAGGASCTISVTFTPQSSGNASGAVSITDDASASPQTVVLSGTGITPAAVSFSPSSLSFSTPLGTSSASQTITVTNTGGATLGITTIAANYPFEIMTSTCVGNLAGGASCSVNISFTPQTSSTVTGAFTTTDNASGSPQSVPLTGTTPAAVAFSPSSLTFSSQAIGTISSAQTVTLTNTGGASLSISGIATSQPFAQTNNCPASLVGGASCSISVTFTAQVSGTASGAVTISDNAAGSPQSLALTGTTPAVASLSPSSLTFPATLIGSTATQTVTLTNTGGASMNITNLSYPNPFSVPSQNCLGTLAGGASCQITVAFKPTASGPVSGVLQITDTASGSPHSVSLSGTGIAPAAVSLSASNLSFGPQLVATISATQTVTLTNTGGAGLSISGISTTQPFAQTNNCPASLTGGASCTINVTFTPQSSGAANGVLTITDSAAGSPQSVSLAGTGVMAAPTLSPASLSFGSQMVGTSSGNQTVKLTANSPGPLAISSISVSAGFTENNNCPASLNSGASCSINMAFQPGAAGAITGTLTIVDNGIGSTQTASLSGTGLDFSVSATPSNVTISSGAKANYTVTVSELGGSFNHNVSLSCSGLPAQSSCSFSPSGVTPGNGSVSSALTIKTTHANGSSGTQPGTYTITITGKSDPLVHSTTVTLVVN